MFPYNLYRNIRKRNPSQIAEDMLHVAISRCNLQWFQNIDAVVTKNRIEFYRCEIIVSPKMLQGKLQSGRDTRCIVPWIVGLTLHESTFKLSEVYIDESQMSS